MTTTLDLDPPRPEPRRDRYGRYLIVPAGGGQPRSYTRATTWAKALDDQSSLINWSMRMCALGLITRKDLYAQVAACRSDDRDALSRLVDQAKEAGGGSSGANIGSALHAFTERIDLGETVDVPDLWQPDVDAYTKAIAEHGLTVRRDLIERVVVVEELGVAGTLDRVYVTADGRLVIGDVKTGQTLDFNRLAISIQLSLYANADTLYDLATETHAPMVDVDKSTALVVHLPSGQGRCEIHEVDIAEGWRYAQLAGQVRAARAHGRRSGGDCLFRAAISPDEWKASRGAHERHVGLVEAGPITSAAFEAASEEIDEHQASRQAYRDWIVSRLEVIRGNTEAARAMQRTWPDGVPGLKTNHQHTVAELEQIAAALDTIEATFMIPFGDTDPRAAKPAVVVEPEPVARPTPPDEGIDVDPAFVTRLIERIDALPEPVRKQLNVWAAEAHKAGRAFSIKTRPSMRRYQIYKACLGLAEFEDDDLVMASLVSVVPSCIALGPSVGAVLGSLTIDEADELNSLLGSIKRDECALAYDPDGVARWEPLTTSNSPDKEQSTS